MKLVIALLVTLSTFSFAQATVVKKVFDGTQVYCPQNVNSTYDSNDKFIRTHVSGGSLIVQASKCVKGKWVADHDLKRHTYTSVTGHHITENYSNFTLIVRNQEWTQFKKIKLSDFGSDSKARISLSNFKSVDSSVVDVNLQADVRIRANNGLDMNDLIEWGAFRVFLKN